MKIKSPFFGANSQNNSNNNNDTLENTFNNNNNKIQNNNNILNNKNNNNNTSLDNHHTSSRIIQQFEYTHWSRNPSHPPLPYHHIYFLNFLKHTQECLRVNLNKNASLLVHSKMAASRCGIFLALDSLLIQGRHLGFVDVKRCVALLR